jgi:hypothetical protein
MTKLAVDQALGARLTAPLEITDKDGRTLGYFLTPPALDRLRQSAEGNRQSDYDRGRQILPDDQLADDAASIDDLCPEAEMDNYRGQQ